MAKLRILSGGAAQGLVNAVAPHFEKDTGYRIDGTFGAVGAMSAKLRAGEPVDVLVLTSSLISELGREGYLSARSAVDIGVVQSAVAVRTGDAIPAIANAEDLRDALLNADAIYFPDPEQATAGIHFAKVLRTLGIWDRVATRLRTFPNGATAMRELAKSREARPIGCTQATEILNTPGVTLVGPLPAGCDLATVYTAAVCAKAAHPVASERLIKMLTGEEAREWRERAGFMPART
jgi:molybdate transport system substrate-binding protein